MQRQILQPQSHAGYYAQKDDAGNPHLCFALRSTVAGSTCFFGCRFYRFFIHCAGLLIRHKMTADEQCVEHNDDRQRNADISKFEESESRQACRRQSACDDNVWRGTDHGDGAAYVGSDCQRHEFFRWRNFSCLADTNNNRHEAGYCTRIGRYRRKNDGNKHDCRHERNLVGARFLDYGDADRFRKTCFKHSGADNEHTAEENYGRIGQTGINLL